MAAQRHAAHGPIGEQFCFDAAADGRGGLYVVASEFRSDPDGDLYLLHYRGDGTPYPGWPASGLPLCTLPQIQQTARVIADGAGGAIVVWEDYRYGIDIYGTHVAADGTRLPGWPENGRLLSNAPDDVSQLNNTPMLVSDAVGGAFVSWQQGTHSVNWFVHILASGLPAPGWTEGGIMLPDRATVDGAGCYAMTADGQGGLLVAWQDQRLGPNNPQIFAQRFSPTGVVAAQFSLVTATVVDDKVDLRWSTAQRPGSDLEIQRRTESTPWQPIGRSVVDGAGFVGFVDEQASLGARYAYRIAVPGASGAASAETWVTVPAAMFALRGANPNPARSANVGMDFTLATRETATLELFDAGGRRVLQRDVTALGPGAHHLTVTGSSRELRAGLYWARLRQGRNEASKRMAVLE